MIAWLLKHWKLMLDALIIIALVVLLFLWNPFGIFGGGLKLETTTNMVTQIQGIGQLVTAEYYGEVIASIDESRLELIYEDSLNDGANIVYADIKHALYNLYQYQQQPRTERVEEFKTMNEKVDGWRKLIRQEVSRNNVLDKLRFHESFDDNKSLVKKVLEYLWREKSGKNRKVNWDPKERHAEEILFLLYNEVAENHKKLNPDAFQSSLNDGFELTKDFSTFFYEDQVSKLSRVEKKKKLAMVGRGWVKAGFDFGSLDEHAFYLNEESGEIHFFGFEPKILNADINPWFIPEKAIPGFEIIDYNGKVNFKDAQKVKQYCIDKLVLYANRAQIIAQAQKQGEETLISFFSLLTGKEIRKIHFHNDEFTRATNAIAQDEYINSSEAILLDSLVSREVFLIDSLSTSRTNRSGNVQIARQKENMLRSQLGKLRKFPFEDTDYPFNYYAAMAFRIAQDSVIDADEQLEIENVRWDKLSDASTSSIHPANYHYWYQDSLQFLMEYNAALDYLMEKCSVAASIRDTILPAKTWENSLATYTIVTHRALADSVRVSYLVNEKEAGQYLYGLLYPFRYEPEEFDRYTKVNKLSDTEVSSRKDTMLAAADKILWVYEPQKQRLVSLLLPPASFLHPQILAKVSDSTSVIALESLYFLLSSDSIRLPVSQLSKPILLQARQKQELLSYYLYLQEANQTNLNKGSIVRASEWVRNKLSNRKNVRSRFQKMREYIWPSQPAD
ncbi:hypothetical protein GXP67_07200 [Rhodocytophaga rosea]|uniref:Uncharacterized protein n=1 Tax=Rhodocytophaga rosea TaxID=2704465 RepID=A0A6C0GEP7_9BACT|nr:hypothetical protein [Rhodocytophaga rosea]QHT66455.1 hypothetical protein GXP67_07200 [Rhodocytophaga rosea]